jgi:hypothetical protein
MEKWLVIAVALGVGLASASGVVAGYQLLKNAEPRPIVRSAPASVAPAPAKPEADETCASAMAAEAVAQHDDGRFQEQRADERGC